VIDPESTWVGFLHLGELLVEELLLVGRGLVVGLDDVRLGDGFEKLGMHIRKSNKGYDIVIKV